MTINNTHTLLVTGGTGSFGKAFVRWHLEHSPDTTIRILSRDEAKQAEMRAALNSPRLRFLVGDVRDRDRMMTACRGVDTVVHAAALKRVETGEDNPDEFVKVNVTGTMNVRDACIERGVRRAVFLSTDKASEPNTLYGGTKFVAERLWLASNVYSAGTHTRFAATRYGNVIASRGSVIPLWREQATTTGTLTVTEPTMTRFWMTLSDSVALVNLALAHMRGGEVFVPKIGAASIRDLAGLVAPGAALTVTGIRPGEKMHESLVGADEARHAYDAGTCYVIEPPSTTWGERPPSPYPPVPSGFVLRSDTTRTLCAEEIQEMLR